MGISIRRNFESNFRHNGRSYAKRHFRFLPFVITRINEKSIVLNQRQNIQRILVLIQN
jgi:hypothetical protein